MVCYLQRLAAVVLSMVSRVVLRTEIDSCCVKYGITWCYLQRLAAVVLSMISRGVLRTEIGSCCVKYGITWCVTYRDWQLLC